MATGLAQYKYAEIRRAMRSLPTIEFFAHRTLLGEGFFGLIFDDGENGLLLASFDRSFRELMVHESRPCSQHFPKLKFDYGQISTPSGLPLHVVSCERLAPIEPLSHLWQIVHELSQAFRGGEPGNPSVLDCSKEWDARAKEKLFDMAKVAKSSSLKECLRNLVHFAEARNLSVSPYFVRHHENLMARGDDVVFVNPLYDSKIRGLPSSFFCEWEASIGSHASEVDRDMIGGNQSEHGDADEER